MGMKKYSRAHDFPQAVCGVVVRIRKGTVLSYADVAKQAGFPGSARAVGSLMRKNHDPGIPCHRVIRSCGRIGAYNRGGEEGKANLLKREGVLLESRTSAGKSTWSVSRRES